MRSFDCPGALEKLALKACQTLPLSVYFSLFSVLLLVLLSGEITFAQSGDVVVFPSSEVELLIGPQLKMGSTLNPYSYFDSTQATHGSTHAAAFPAVPPMGLTGTVSVNNGSLTVIGVGTRFLSEVDPFGPAPYFNGRLTVLEPGGTYRQVQVAAVQGDTQLTLTEPYAYSSQTGVGATTYFKHPVNGWNNDIYMNANYYDLALCLYSLYYRTGNPAFLANARKVADSWWLSPQIKGGTVRNFQTYSYSPRNSSLGGLMLRALDGRPEMWDWINEYTRFMFDNWVKVRINDPQLYQGVRDGSYMMLYAAWLGRVLPSSFPLTDGGRRTNGAQLRAQFLADAQDAAVNYYVRLQYHDGSWRWDDGYYTDADGGRLQGITQPFMVGLLLHSLIDVYRGTSSSRVKETIKASVLKAVDHLYNGGPYMKRNAGIPNSPIRWRAFNYFYHGGTTVNPTKYANGDYAGINASTFYDVEGARQASSTILHAMGWAYSVTGDQRFADWGDDVYDSIFGFTEDHVSNYVAGGDQKGYNQHYRAAGRYLAWRYGPNPSPAPPSTPPPTPPTPDPTPIPATNYWQQKSLEEFKTSRKKRKTVRRNSQPQIRVRPDVNEGQDLRLRSR